MANYGGIQKEETLKSLVRDDFFSDYGYEPNIDNIDIVFTNKTARGDLFSGMDAADTRQVRNADLGEFCDVSEGNSKTPNMKSRTDARFHGSSVHIAYGESKKEVTDLYAMFTQLILTCKKTYDKGVYLAPPWLLVFDPARIAFVPFHEMLPIFTETDFNWNQTPSNHDTTDFQKARRAVEKLIGAKIVVFHFGADDADIHEFIKTHFTLDGNASIKSPITKDNFVQIYHKWIKAVRPFINIAKEEWADYKHEGILECDFYRADVMSAPATRELGENVGIFSKHYFSITEKLKIVLKNDNYSLRERIKGRLFTSDIDFTDGGAAYSRFWNRYERPPAPVYQQHIIDRRDLLLPQNIREVKGSFFTPAIWADKSKEYLADVFGDKWQDEYYIWDCAAGTGNLLAGLSNPYNVWASDIEAGNVETMQSLIDIDENLNLLPGHVFQFDFLNDGFDKLPEELRKIINDPKMRKRLIVYINPPYAEVSSIQGGKKGVNQSKTHDKYANELGTAGRELFTQFFIRIVKEIPDSKLAAFSKMKHISGSAFENFRNNFLAKYKKGFICLANTFDNVSGQFPIGFQIWDCEKKSKIKNIKCDILDNNGKKSGVKSFYAYENSSYINEWISKYNKIPQSEYLGFLAGTNGNGVQHNRIVYILNKKEQMPNPRGVYITAENIIESAVYLAVRHCVESTWLNDRDQFLYPNDKWEIDTEFQNDCLVFTLFQNNISCKYGVNHWIPFTESEVDARAAFESHFMVSFLNGKIIKNAYTEDLFSFLEENKKYSASHWVKGKKRKFSLEALAVLDAGRELWKYYHAKIKNNNTASVNASFYDIREFFQGRKENGTMNAKSDDETYNALIGTLRDAQKLLAAKIAPKVYEYGFLKE